MRRIILSGGALEVSRFVLGTASLFNVGSQRERVRLLDAAVEHGFTHFDTAPLYGFGMAERDLAPVLARHRHLSVTTKVGLYAPGGEYQSFSAVFARKALGRMFPTLSAARPDWTVERARKSLDGSLKRLGREQVDIYTLHEPDVHALRQEEWLRWLEDEVQAGRVGRFGIAVDGTRLTPFVASNSELLQFVQCLDSLEGREADCLTVSGRPMHITYGYVSDAMRRHGHVDVPKVLHAALDRNRMGAVIVSTRRAERLAQYAAIADGHDQ